MKSLSISSGYLDALKKRESKHKYKWQEDAENISKYFGVPLYWTFHKYPEHKILLAYRTCQEKGMKSVPYFLGVLKNTV